MVASSDLIGRAVATCGLGVGNVGVRWCSRSSGDVEDAQLLILSTSREYARALARREGNGAYNVRVVQGDKSLAGEGIPNFCAEVGAASCCQSSVLGQPGAPDGTLVSNEGTNPIAGQAVAKHRELIFTCGHHVELRAGGLRVQGGGKRKVSNGARVSVASQWHGLGGA